MRKPYERSLLEKSTTQNGLSGMSELEIAKDARQDLANENPNIFDSENKRGMGGYEALIELSDTYVTYLLKNSPGNLPGNIYEEKDVLAKEDIFKKMVGPKLGSELVKDLYKKIDTELDKALGVDSPKRA